MSDIISKIEKLLEEKFQEPEFSDCFLVDYKFNAGKKLEIYIDSDANITFEKCRKISRYLEAYLDEEEQLSEHYVLEVSSPGLDRPLKFVRQYVKNIGRKLKVETEGGKKSGRLIAANESEIVLEMDVVEKVGKKKVKKKVEEKIAINHIIKAKVKAEF